jgi:hypothetical protein
MLMVTLANSVYTIIMASGESLLRAETQVDESNTKQFNPRLFNVPNAHHEHHFETIAGACSFLEATAPVRLPNLLGRKGRQSLYA